MSLTDNVDKEYVGWGGGGKKSHSKYPMKLLQRLRRRSTPNLQTKWRGVRAG